MATYKGKELTFSSVRDQIAQHYVQPFDFSLDDSFFKKYERAFDECFAKDDPTKGRRFQLIARHRGTKIGLKYKHPDNGSLDHKKFFHYNDVIFGTNPTLDQPRIFNYFQEQMEKSPPLKKYLELSDVLFNAVKKPVDEINALFIRELGLELSILHILRSVGYLEHPTRKQILGETHADMGFSTGHVRNTKRGLLVGEKVAEKAIMKGEVSHQEHTGVWFPGKALESLSKKAIKATWHVIQKHEGGDDSSNEPFLRHSTQLFCDAYNTKEKFHSPTFEETHDLPKNIMNDAGQDT